MKIMSVIGPTERKLGDARFRKNEEAIIKAFFDCDGGRYSVAEIAQRAGIDRATFYRHHKTVYEIMSDCENETLAKFSCLLQSLLSREGISIKAIYYQLLIFVLKNHDIFVIFIKERRMGVVGDMVQMLIPKIRKEYGLFGDLERVFRAYIGEIVGLVEEWGENGFKEEEITSLLNDIMYLTKTIRCRLLPLTN